MNAKEANELAAKSRLDKRVGPALAHALNRIKEAAEKGEFSVTHPLYGYGSSELETEVLQELRGLGYKCMEISGDAGDPRDAAYSRVSWG